MADDEDTVPGIADAGTPVKTPVVKKPRGPRRQKSATEVTTPDLAKSGIIPRTRRKRDKDTGELEPVSAAGKTAAKAAPQTTGRSGKNAAAKPPEAVAAINEMADLLQLEEENKRLRNLLADKLRGENADLRKRLGLD